MVTSQYKYLGIEYTVVTLTEKDVAIIKVIQLGKLILTS